MILIPIFTILAISHAQDKGDELPSRIWYGKKASIKDYPFYAGLNDVWSSCGAAILSHWWLVTAGHCYDSKYLELETYVWVGAEDETNAKHYEVDLEILHPGYTATQEQNYGIILNDIAVVRVKTPLTFSDKVQPIKLPQHDYEVNTLHSFAGLGKDETGKSPKYLMEVTTRTRDIGDFLKLFKETKKFKRLKPLMSSLMMCTKRDGDLPSLCFGDSGSALVRNNTLVGLASFLGNIEGDCGIPGCVLLTNVYPFVDWIKSVTRLR